MKKRITFFAFAAALAFCYSCSNDETVATNDNAASNEISFRPVVSGVTRSATDPQVKTAFAATNVINVWADYDSQKYFYDAYTYSTDPSAFNSADKHYWPATVSNEHPVTFTATYGGVTQTAGGTFAGFTPATSASNQIDLLVAKHVSESKENPVLLNFRHALSQIAVKVKNTNANLRFVVHGVRIGYVATAATNFVLAFDNSAANSNTQQQAASGSLTTGADLISSSSWTLTAATSANANKYDQTLTANSCVIEGETASDIELNSATHGFYPWLLLPQTMKAFTTDSHGGSGKEYVSKSSTGTHADDPDLSGTYIALQLTIQNWNGTTATGGIVDTKWCYWPIDGLSAWNPGKKYIYTVDVAGGGYLPTDNDNDGKLDTILDEIVISPSCTIDVWNVQSDLDVNN